MGCRAPSLSRLSPPACVCCVQEERKQIESSSKSVDERLKTTLADLELEKSNSLAKSKSLTQLENDLQGHSSRMEELKTQLEESNRERSHLTKQLETAISALRELEAAKQKRNASNTLPLDPGGKGNYQ